MAAGDNNGGGGGGDVSEIGVGMRVLAVDDDPTCLAVLAGLLRKCKYQVTATNQAIKALKLLREDKTRFDLVISDVSMPDMDGFKLLELVGIEMDLPVIMLSQYSDKEFVYKGVKHGAVDYLVKPVRLDMLQNIWQHVIRKKTPKPRDQNNSADYRGHDIVGDSAQGAASSDSMDCNAKLNRKRKDQDDEEDEGSDDNGNENDEHGNQKKPRVVWSVDLHKKFVAAVNQLGFEKAVPKKILDLMDVEGLTRENVASHLQKYRLYLKRLSVVPPHQGNMVGAFGASDAAFLRMDSMDGFGDFRSLSGPGRVSHTSLTSYMPGGMSARFNTPGGLTLHGITNSGLHQGHSQSSSNSLNIAGKLQPALLSGNQAISMLHGVPSTLQPNQLHGSSSTLNGYVDKSSFTIANGFPDARAMTGSLANTMSNVPGNLLMRQVNSQQNQNRGSLANQPSPSAPSDQQSFEVGISGSSNFIDRGRCNDNWQIAVQLSKFPSTTTPINDSFNHEQSSAHNLRNNISTASSLICNNDFSASNHLPLSLGENVMDNQRQAGLISNVVRDTNYASKQRWEDHSQANNPSLISSFGNMNSMVSGNALAAPLPQGMGQRTKYGGPFTGQINDAPPSIYQHAEVDRPFLDQKLRSNNEYLLEQTKSENSFIQNNYDDLDDLMNTMIKRDPSENMLMEGEYAFDAYSL